jgi:hypothetical protein
MVSDNGQIYTIEGITAGIIMIVTAYLILSTSTIFTPGDVHITDMQLEQTGGDALAMLDTPNSYIIYNESPNTTKMSYFIQKDDKIGFESKFTDYLNNKTALGSYDNIHYTANIYFPNGSEINNIDFSNSGKITGRENTIKVTRLVLVNNSANDNTRLPEKRVQMVLVEVLLWR